MRDLSWGHLPLAHTWNYQVTVTVQWLLHTNRRILGFPGTWEKQTACLKLVFRCNHTGQRRKRDKQTTDQPCWKSAAAVRCESDLRFVAVQGAHGLLKGGALHSAAVHTEYWGANRGMGHCYVYLHLRVPKWKPWLFEFFQFPYFFKTLSWHWHFHFSQCERTRIWLKFSVQEKKGTGHRRAKMQTQRKTKS